MYQQFLTLERSREVLQGHLIRLVARGSVPVLDLSALSYSGKRFLFLELLRSCCWMIVVIRDSLCGGFGYR